MKNTILFTALCGVAIVPSIVAAPVPVASLDSSSFMVSGVPPVAPAGPPASNLGGSQFIPGGIPAVTRGGSSTSSSHVSGGDASNGGSAGSVATAGPHGTSVSPTASSNVSGQGANSQSNADAHTIQTANGGSASWGSALSSGTRDATQAQGLANLKPEDFSLNQNTDNEESTVAFAWDGGSGGDPFTFSSSVGSHNGRPSSSSGKK